MPRRRAPRPTPSQGSLPLDIETFLNLEHPIYRAWKARWALNEQRLMGGDEVYEELEAFEWETDLTDTGHLNKRRNKAIYVNFPDIYLSGITGHLLRFAPRPGAALDLGKNLGKVNDVGTKKTAADNLFYKPDGPGNSGSNWDLWWADAMRLAGATGHRWGFVETPSTEPKNKAEELNGLHPYLVEYSPLDVPYWEFDAYGNVCAAYIRFTNYKPDRLAPYGESTTNHYSDYLLIVAEGYTALGPKYSGGGWWKFTPEKEEYDTGDFSDCLGQIPMFPIFYDRAKGTKKRPAISRPGVTELGQAAVAAMDITSAGNYSAWDGGQGITFMLGVDEESQQLAIGQIKRGDRYIGVQPNQDTDETPQIHDRASQSIDSTVFDVREKAIWNAAVQLGISEAVGMGDQSGSGGPGNTGSAQQARFSSGQAPRIVRMAANMEQAQNKALYFYELRLGHLEPQAKTSWPKKFDLVELTDRIKQFFEIQRLAGVSSPTLDSNAMVQVADDKGLLTNPDDREKVNTEYQKSAALKIKQQETQSQPKTTAGNNAPGNKKAADRIAGKKANKAGPKKNPGGLRA